MSYYYRKFTIPFVFFFLALPAFSAQAAQNTENAAAKLERAIFNFHQIEPGIYRSGRLHADTYPYLKQLGIKTAVNFIDHKRESLEEKEGLASFGIDTVWIPWNGFDYPKDQDVEKFLSVMRDPARRPILIHCKRGAERTGIMTACWRVAEKGWSADQAFDEMKRNRFRAFWYGHLKKYLYDFAKRYGQKAEDSNNIWEKAKTNFLYGVYRLRKLNPFN